MQNVGLILFPKIECCTKTLNLNIKVTKSANTPKIEAMYRSHQHLPVITWHYSNDHALKGVFIIITHPAMV